MTRHIAPHFPPTLALLALCPTTATAQTLLWEVPETGSLAVVEDLDGDGLNELRIGFRVFSGADGSFVFDTDVPSPGPPYQFQGQPIGDVDGDRYPDVAFLLAPPASTTNEPVVVYSGLTKAFLSEGRPLGGFIPWLDTITWATGDADVDADGVDDLVYGSTDFNFGGSAQGYFSGAGFGQGPVNTQGLIHIGYATKRAILGDVEGDGVADVIFHTGDVDFASSWYEARTFAGGGGLLGFLYYLNFEDTVTGAADVDGDGRQDILTVLDGFGSPPGPLVALSAVDQAQLLSIPGNYDAAFGVGDVDCDGREDVLAVSAATKIFSGADASTLWQAPIVTDLFARTGDLNGDGIGDWALGSLAQGLTQIWAGPAPPTPSYCTGKVNSGGCVPEIGASGTPTAQGPDDFAVTCRDVLAQKPGLFFWGTSGPIAVPFLGGTLCVAPPLQRGPVLVSAGAVDCVTAGYVFPFGQALAAQHGIAPGTAVHGQFWMRDPASADGTGVALSNGVAFPWCE